jgi:hypothetical protein
MGDYKSGGCIIVAKNATDRQTDVEAHNVFFADATVLSKPKNVSMLLELN